MTGDGTAKYRRHRARPRNAGVRVVCRFLMLNGCRFVVSHVAFPTPTSLFVPCPQCPPQTCPRSTTMSPPPKTLNNGLRRFASSRLVPLRRLDEARPALADHRAPTAERRRSSGRVKVSTFQLPARLHCYSASAMPRRSAMAAPQPCRSLGSAREAVRSDAAAKTASRRALARIENGTATTPRHEVPI